MFLPDFIGIGGNRSGSSWLWANLRRHPDIWTPNAKELHLFSRRLKKGPARLFGRSPTVARLAYRRYFLKSGFRGDLIRGEVTPAYSTFDTADIEWVHRTVPDAKILFIMRNPLERVWSHARKDFADFTGLALADASRKDFDAFLARPEVRSRSDYAATIERWSAVWGSEGIKILFLETCLEDPKHALTDLFIHLGADPKRFDVSDEMLQEKVNARDEAPMPAHFREPALEIVIPMVRHLRRLRPDLTLPWPDFEKQGS